MLTEGFRILLEMAYKPAVTTLIQRAQDAGWKTVNGLEVLVGQGVHQFEYWTGIKPLWRIARVSFLFLFLFFIFSYKVRLGGWILTR